MLIPKLLFFFSKTALTSGSFWSASWVPTEDYKIEGILIRRADGQPWTASTITMLLGNRAITRDEAPVAIFGVNEETKLPLNIEIAAHEELKWTLYNNEGATITVYMTIIAIPKTPITGG